MFSSNRSYALSLSALAVTMSLTAAQIRAALVAADDVSNAPYADGLDNGDNGGTGFLPFQLATGNKFIGNSQGNGFGDGNIDVGGKSFGQYGTQTLTRPFTGALSVGQQFSVKFDNGFLDGGNVAEIRLADTAGNQLFSFGFTGGTSNYRLDDAVQVSMDTGLNFSSAGFQIGFTLTSATTYDLTVLRQLNNFTYNYSGTIAGAIDRVQVFTAPSTPGGSGDVFSNNYAIINVPEPTSLAAIGLIGAGVLARRRKV